jgi:uracil-DNA glycosylase family 4
VTITRRKKKTRRAGLKSKARSTAEVATRPIVLPGHEPKSGCRWCPLFPWSPDFPCGGDYNRDAEKIIHKEPEGHSVRNRCVQENDWNQVDILCVGDAVGANEDKSATPFMGQGGTLLRSAIEALCETTLDDQGQELLTKEQFGFTSIARCRPPRNKKPGKTIVQSCAPQLVRELKARKPKVIVAMGGVALEHLTGQTGIVMFSGRVLDCTLEGFEHIKVVACVAPAYVCRMDHEMPRFIEAFEQVRDVALGSYEALPGVGDYFVLDTLDGVRELIEMYQEDGTKVAIDTETGSLYWFQTEFPALLCFSLTNRAGEAYVIPLDHKESPWRIGGPLEHEREELFELIGGLLENPDIEKVLQNGKFDDKHMFHATGYKLINYRDTMLTHLVLDERKGTHRLKQLAYTYTGMGGYEQPLEDYQATHPDANPKRGGSYANIPGDFLFPYAAMDADVTFRCDDGLLAEPAYTSNEKFQTLAEVFLPALAVALADMEYEGAQVDPEVVEQLDVKYTTQMADKTAEVAEFPEVVDYSNDPDKIGEEGEFNPGSGPQLQQVLFGLMGETPIHLTKGGRERVALRYNNSVAAWRKARKGRKPRFQSHVKAAVKAQEWNLFATDAEVLHELERNGNELCPLILQYREAETLHGTFVKPLKWNLDPYGRIHGNFNIPGTVTGRLSSDDPNLQNIPNKGGALIKSAYVSRFGAEGLIGQADYSQVELRVAASLFDEQSMIDTYIRGEDMHLNTALDLFSLTKTQYDALDSHEQKRQRTQAKRINFGILYGGGPPALQTALRKDGDFISLDECEALIERYFEVRPQLKKGIEALEASVCELGYLESFTGRRRRIPEVFSEDEQIVARALRQSVNFPVQNGASEMTLMSLVLIWNAMQEKGYRSKMILTVHDSIIFDLHVDEAYEVMALAKYIMEHVVELSAEVFPGLDWSWLKVPVVCDCELGTNWKTLVDFDPDDFDEEELWERMAAKHAA